MKKSLLVISVILLIAGLFISCNSEAAGTNSEVGYVKFGDSKALTASVTPESGPAISSLYWYYKATKTSGGIAIGQTDAWKRVNPNSTGLVGTIGPFSKGSWAFELVGTTSTTAPANTSYNPQGTAGSKWTIGDESVKYYGVSGTTGEENRTPITLTTGTTVIPVSLKWRQTSTTATVKFDNVSVLDSSETMVLPANTTVYLTVKFGDAVLADNISATNTTAGSNVYYSNSTGLTISAGKLGTKNLYVEVYENSERTSKVQEGSVGFTAAAGDTITITGNIGSMEAYYGEFLDSSKTAYVFNGSSFAYYDTFEEAIDAAAPGNTVGLLENVSLSGCSTTGNQVFLIDKSVTIEGNNHTLTLENTATTKTSKSTGLLFSNCSYYTTGDKQAVDGDLGTKTWTISNLTIVGNDMLRTILVDSYCNAGNNRSSLTLDNVVINSNCECLYANGESIVVANNCTFNSTNTYGESWTTDSHPVYKSAVMVGYGSNITLDGCNIESDYNCLGVFPSGGGTVATNNCEIVSSNTSVDYAAIYVTNDNYRNYTFCTDSVIKIASGLVTGNVILRGLNNSADATSNYHSYFAIAPGVEFNGQIKDYDYSAVDYKLWNSTSVEPGYTWYTVRPTTVDSLDNYTPVQ